MFVNVIYAFTSLEEVIKGGPSGDKPPIPSNPPSINNKVLEHLTVIKKQIQRMQYAQQPQTPYKLSWAKITVSSVPLTAITPRGRVITLCPTDKDNTFKGKDMQEILKEVWIDFPGAVSVHPLRSSDI